MRRSLERGGGLSVCVAQTGELRYGPPHAPLSLWGIFRSRGGARAFGAPVLRGRFLSPGKEYQNG
ncbi:hypothetical protein HMPREF0372_03434 [Flavonifractor plautii ATCC 29863]|uniref:Uncharacterized protein n=1 Tax=Flavonifractor plautii ATCC 29863 TaxID=411475 RepID=G9YV69_FLAPL|nr:hypothetical protein HMPREF0372_03434 [Flavonifractor plautii ATCC 29863]